MYQQQQQQQQQQAYMDPYAMHYQMSAEPVDKAKAKVALFSLLVFMVVLTFLHRQKDCAINVEILAMWLVIVLTQKL